jgi:hypothetical protein
MREGDGSGGLTLESIVPTSRDRSMFRIEHVAFWIENVERLVDFYVAYFGATAGSRYVNVAKGYESRFLSFAGGARIEVMNSSVLHPVKQDAALRGWGSRISRCRWVQSNELMNLLAVSKRRIRGR